MITWLNKQMNEQMLGRGPPRLTTGVPSVDALSTIRPSPVVTHTQSHPHPVTGTVGSLGLYAQYRVSLSHIKTLTLCVHNLIHTLVYSPCIYTYINTCVLHTEHLQTSCTWQSQSKLPNKNSPIIILSFPIHTSHIHLTIKFHLADINQADFSVPIKTSTHYDMVY